MIDNHAVSGKRPFPPRVTHFTRPFWEALASGRWISSQCRSCGRQTFPPKVVCPQCWSDDIAWEAMPTRGTVYSWTRIHAGPAMFQVQIPYAVCIVDLEQRLRLACPLLIPEGLQPGIGAPVEMVAFQYEDGPLFAARLQADPPAP